MIVYIDSNIILDVMLPNPKFHDESEKVISVPTAYFDLYISAAAITDIYYVARKALKDKERAKNTITELLNGVSVAGVDETCIRNALDSDWKDFEDSVQHEAAQQIKADLIITRNVNDYVNSAIRVMTPSEFLSFIK